MRDHSEKLRQAIALHRQGNLDAAEAVYRDVLLQDPTNHNAQHLQGVIFLQKHDPLKAVESLSQAVQLYDRSAAYFCNLGTAFHQLEQFEHAIKNFQKSLKLNPNYIEAQFNLSNVYHETGDLVHAIEALECVIQIDPNHAEANTSLRLIDLEREENSLSALQHLLVEQPANAALHHKIGTQLYQEGRHQEALQHFERVLEFEPMHAPALNNKGLTLLELGDHENAVKTFRSLLQSQPSHREARCNLGIALKQVGELEEAIDCFQQLLSRDPEDFESWNNLGNAYKQFKQFDQAENCYRKAIECCSTFAVAHGNLGKLLQTTGDAEQGLKHLQTAHRLEPNVQRRLAKAFVIPPIYRSENDLIHWRNRLENEIGKLIDEGLVYDPGTHLAPTFFFAAFHGRNDRTLAENVARLARTCSSPKSIAPPRQTDARIHLGFYSSYFYNHTIGHLMRGMIAELDRNKFHVTVYSPGEHQDEFGQHIRHAADEYLVISKDLSKACQEIVECHLDLLFFSDLGMEPISSCLAHHRLAPVQCVTWGHPVTSGIPTVDYFLSSELLEIPEAQAHYSEKLVRLKSLPTFYSAPVRSSQATNRCQIGFTESDHLYICPQSLFKLHPEFDAILKEILQQDSRGKLVLIEGLHKQWTEFLKQRFTNSLGNQFEKVRFLPRQPYQNFLQTIASADVILDPIHFGGGNTNYESFALGVPVVTLPSSMMRTRVATALYRKMEIDGAVCGSAEEYVFQALQIANDKDYSKTLRKEIRGNCHKIFEDRLALQELENFFVRSTQQVQSSSEQRSAS